MKKQRTKTTGELNDMGNENGDCHYFAVVVVAFVWIQFLRKPKFYQFQNFLVRPIEAYLK